MCTTYAVGELSALNGVIGAKAENNIIFHLVGTPPSSLIINHKQAHHTLGDGVLGQFKCYQVVLLTVETSSDGS